MKLFSFLLFLILFGQNSNSQTIFRTACNGNTARLDSMLTTTPIDIKDDFGQSLLHWAVACKQSETFHYLIKKGIAVNDANSQGKTPLYMAVKYNAGNILDTLIVLQPNTKWKLSEAGELLTIAALRNNESAIRTLANEQLNLDSRNERGSSALEIAQRAGNDNLVELLISLGADPNKINSVEMRGLFMDQNKPNKIPKLFAPNFISTELEEFGSVFNKAGDEFYYGAHLNGKSEIKYSKLENGKWTKPKTILVHDRYGYNDPFLSPDENRLYFISSRALDGKSDPKDIDIWYIEKQGEVWSEPINAGTNINSDKNEYYISFTNDGTMYFSSNANDDSNNDNYDVYYSKFKNNQFLEPVKLNTNINSESYEADVFVAPDESYIIFCSTRANGFGQGDLYMSFKDENNNWTKAVNMGNAINSENYEYCPFVTYDGKFLFYTSNQDIYWVSTTIFEDIKKKLD